MRDSSVEVPQDLEGMKTLINKLHEDSAMEVMEMLKKELPIPDRRFIEGANLYWDNRSNAPETSTQQELRAHIWSKLLEATNTLNEPLLVGVNNLDIYTLMKKIQEKYQIIDKGRLIESLNRRLNKIKI